MRAAIIGWNHSRFGKQPGEDLESLIVKAAGGALADAGVSAGDIDQIVVGNYGEGFSSQGFPASLVLQCDDALRFTPAVRVENACATGSAAVFHGCDLIAAGKARLVLVVGAEKMTDLSGPALNQALLKAAYVKEEGEIKGGFAGVFGRIAELYFERHGDQSDALAAIAAKNHANGVANPFAQMRKDLGFDFCRRVCERNPIVAGPLRRTDCALVSDGAAAVVLADQATAKTWDKAISFRGMASVSDFLPISKRDITFFEGCQQAWQKGLAAAGLGLGDLSLVETHDCFTIAELLEYEAMGLAARGQAAEAALDGWTEKSGRLPVNPSGGLKSKGHPIGATGVSMHILSAMQLMDDAGEMQVPGAALAGIFNMGGAAVANYVSILERLR